MKHNFFQVELVILILIWKIMTFLRYSEQVFVHGLEMHYVCIHGKYEQEMFMFEPKSWYKSKQLSKTEKFLTFPCCFFSNH